MSKRKGWVTAASLQSELEADPEFVRRRRQEEAERAARLVAIREEARPIDADLLDAKVDPASVMEYAGRTASAQAIPVFIKHLGLPYSTELRATMAASLATRHADPYFDAIRELLFREMLPAGSEIVRERLAVAVSDCVNSKENLLKLNELVWDRSLGKLRLLMLARFKEINDQAVVSLFKELARDPELRAGILSWKSYWRRWDPGFPREPL